MSSSTLSPSSNTTLSPAYARSLVFCFAKEFPPTTHPCSELTGLSPAELLAKYPGVSRRLRKGQTIGDIAQLESVSESTVKKVKKALLGA